MRPLPAAGSPRPVRRAALYDRLASGGGQVWMTGTEDAPFEALKGQMTHFIINGSGNDPQADPAPSSTPTGPIVSAS